ncbi:MAG: hypothetical protein ABF876_15145 [Acetobacter aceti]|uniref:Uncharacterized protein n=1 Tax=Acetobacter aceti TaxID=435 RepID=A0A1U9KJR9_ACEAC|nr:hypothetical protein [Acetobacter aceti]AQS86040.1 hypothetical protein A0U92_16210 [Acetobacter aceti]
MNDDKAEKIVGTGPEDGPAQVSSTEDGPAAPGWLEPEVDKAFATLGLPADKLRSLRDSYIDCLASAPRGQDLDVAHDACRRGLLTALHSAFPLDDDRQQAFRLALEALESRLTADL